MSVEPGAKEKPASGGSGPIDMKRGARNSPNRAIPPPSAMSALRVRRDKAALSSGCEPHPANAPAGSNRSSHGGDEMAEAFGVAVTYR